MLTFLAIALSVPIYHKPAADALKNHRYTRLGPYLFQTRGVQKRRHKKARPSRG
jgi:hypothetical protein